MPYAIRGPHGDGGISSYQLGGKDEWTLKAATFLVDMSNATDDDALFLDCRDANGGIINSQVVDFIFQTSFYSLSESAEPMLMNSQNSTVTWPQTNPGQADFVTERLTPVTLTAGCTVNVYASLGAPTPPTDPITSLDTGVVIENLHLWVEDTHGIDVGALTVGNPLLLGAGT